MVKRTFVFVTAFRYLHNGNALVSRSVCACVDTYVCALFVNSVFRVCTR